MKTLTVFAFVCSFYIQADASQCAMKYQSPAIPGKHTACLEPSPNLLKVIPLSGEDQNKIVKAHNDFRMAEDATDMLKMSWDDELAMLAEKWGSTCPSGHDEGPLRQAIGRFNTGQNLYYSTNENLDPAGAVMSWASEKKDFTFGGTFAQQTGDVGHYTQVVWAKSFKVGCAGVRCKNVKFGTIFVCNYGPAGNIYPNQFKPYTAGTDCSECSSHCTDGLCDCGGLLCLNDGSLNLDTCQCNCFNSYPWYKPETCELDCPKAKDMGHCPQYGKPACKQYSNVPHECPNMCGKC